MTGDTPKHDLREMIRAKQIVVVVGSGVSIATNKNAPTWQGLIASAADRCRSLGAKDSWRKQVASQLELKDDADILLSAAELVHRKLKNSGDGNFARWLRDCFGALHPEDPSVITAIAGFDAPILTTNYDDLIEKVTGRKHVTWQDSANVAKVARGDDSRVLHLHGHWEHPDSVVLGIQSYEGVRNNKHVQAVMQAFGVTKSFVFIGCGDGLDDPNFGSFLTWLEDLEGFARVEHEHYRLVTTADDVKQRGRIFPLVYGDEYADLPGFLQELNPVLPHVDAGQAGPIIVRTSIALPDTVTTYLDRLAEDTCRLKLLGMGRSFQIELPISEAYVPLKANLSRSMELKTTERFAEHHTESEINVELADVFQHAKKRGDRGVILLGEPGSGKTTGARQLAWQLASRQRLPKDLGLPDRITPVLLRFRNLSSKSLAEENGLKTFLTEQTECGNAPDGLNSPGDDLWNGRGGPLLWILDGLDEIIDPDARKSVSTWIQKAIRERTKDYFLVTCRFAGYYRDGVPLGSSFTEFHVRPLDDDQIGRFVRDWYTAAYRKLDHAPELAESRAAALLSVLQRQAYQTNRIRELCTNPLLLTILCIVYHDDQTLPDNRSELYEHCVRVLLQHWRRDVYESELGRAIPAFDAKAAQSVLARVAWWMHSKQDRTAAPVKDLAKQATSGLLKTKPESGLGQDGLGFLNRMKDETGIVAAENDGRFGFLHLSFQEYLAADYAASHSKAKDLAPRVTESWWQEVALLSLRHSERYCKAFFREMLAAGIAENHPDLADRCLNEALWFNARPFLDVLKTEAPPTRIAAVLRLLRNRTDQIPGLGELVAPFAASAEESVRSVAREVLARLGIEPQVTSGSPEFIVTGPAEIAYVRIPAGEFRMGSPKSKYDDERPVHSVRISGDFLLARYPVTNGQYTEFMKDRQNISKPMYWEDRRFNQPEQPVVGVSWDDAQAFCEWAGCRLPTEAEWEYACRAGTPTEYSFGDDAEQLAQYAWYDKNSSGQTHPVGTKLPNPWGLHDMHGNVWEWCQDRWDAEYYSKSPLVDPRGSESGTGRVLRGGSWLNQAGSCRSAIRDLRRPVLRYLVSGFRVARTL